MCGIAGIVGNNKAKVEKTTLKKMTDAIAHRGPDGEGLWVNEDRNIGLGHRRLSIIDLTECGAQPMQVADRYVVVFNGEIYNYIELKNQLIRKGYTFKSATDTEVLVLMYDAYKEECLQYFDGMFAFVIYDRSEDKIFGARDRFGEKPLFFHIDDDRSFSFASEIKALWSIGVPKVMDERFLFNYLIFGYTQNPDNLFETFYKNIQKVPASHYFTYDLNAASVSFHKYWDIDINRCNNTINEKEAAMQLDELLVTSLKRRLRSDVPIGSSLSGGLDSSIIVSLLDKIDENKNIRRKTFSASFPGFEKDETKYQKMVIEKTSVEPYFVYPDERSFFENFKTIAYHQDEPFGSASINIQFEVFKKAKEQATTVLLDGQGADEIFAGYHGYYYAFFDELKNNSGKELKHEYALYKAVHEDNVINAKINVSRASYLKNKIPAFLKEPIKRNFIKLPAARKVLSKTFYSNYKSSLFSEREVFSSLNDALYYSVFKRGLEELLRYADRNSMAHSREVRLPFLNHELVTFVFSLPSTFKMKEGWTKWILRHTYKDVLDQRIAWRKDKIGYEPPQKKWLANGEFRQQIIGSTQKLKDMNVIGKDFRVEAPGTDISLLWRLVMVGDLFS
jgi:asparagine synthase (glutamine-hydrolysing)